MCPSGCKAAGCAHAASCVCVCACCKQSSWSRPHFLGLGFRGPPAPPWRRPPRPQGAQAREEGCRPRTLRRRLCAEAAWRASIGRLAFSSFQLPSGRPCTRRGPHSPPPHAGAAHGAGSAAAAPAAGRRPGRRRAPRRRRRGVDVVGRRRRRRAGARRRGVWLGHRPPPLHHRPELQPGGGQRQRQRGGGHRRAAADGEPRAVGEDGACVRHALLRGPPHRGGALRHGQLSSRVQARPSLLLLLLLLLFATVVGRLASHATPSCEQRLAHPLAATSHPLAASRTLLPPHTPSRRQITPSRRLTHPLAASYTHSRRLTRPLAASHNPSLPNRTRQDRRRAGVWRSARGGSHEGA